MNSDAPESFRRWGAMRPLPRVGCSLPGILPGRAVHLLDRYVATILVLTHENVLRMHHLVGHFIWKYIPRPSGSSAFAPSWRGPRDPRRIQDAALITQWRAVPGYLCDMINLVDQSLACRVGTVAYWRQKRTSRQLKTFCHSPSLVPRNSPSPEQVPAYRSAVERVREKLTQRVAAGRVFAFLASMPTWKSLPTRVVVARLMSPMQLGQVKSYTDADGRVAGVVINAWWNPDDPYVLSQPLDALEIFDWNSGPLFCIVTCLMTSQVCEAFVCDLARWANRNSSINVYVPACGPRNASVQVLSVQALVRELARSERAPTFDVHRYLLSTSLS